MTGRGSAMTEAHVREGNMRLCETLPIKPLPIKTRRAPCHVTVHSPQSTVHSTRRCGFASLLPPSPTETHLTPAEGGRRDYQSSLDEQHGSRKTKRTEAGDWLQRTRRPTWITCRVGF